MEEEGPLLQLIVDGTGINLGYLSRFLETIGVDFPGMVDQELPEHHGATLHVRSFERGSIIAYFVLVAGWAVTFEDQRIAMIGVIKRLIRAARILIDMEGTTPPERDARERNVVIEGLQLVNEGGADRIQLNVFGDNANFFVIQRGATVNNLIGDRRELLGPGEGVAYAPTRSSKHGVRARIYRTEERAWRARIGEIDVPVTNVIWFADQLADSTLVQGVLEYSNETPSRFAIEHVFDSDQP